MDQPDAAAGGPVRAAERLQDLIRRRKVELRLTGDDLQQRATAAGHHMSRHMWNRLMRDEWPARTPEIPLDCIAEVLQVTKLEVWNAAGRSLGVATAAVAMDDPHVEMVAAILEPHSPAERDGLVEVMRSASSVVGAVAPRRSGTPGGSA